MLVATRNADLVNKLLALAGGDIDLVQRAVRIAATDSKSADLEMVVNLIVEQRKMMLANNVGPVL
jgi:hypothetical protein